MADLMEVGKALAFLSSIHTEKQISKETMRAYHLVLSDLPAELLMAAVVQLASTSQWMPKPAEIRKAAAELGARSQGKGTPTAEQAWIEVNRCIARIGHVGLPEWSHRLIGQAVEVVGGWRLLCLSTNQIADRAHFIKAYTGLYTRSLERAVEHPAVREAIESMATGLALPAGPIRQLTSGSD